MKGVPRGLCNVGNLLKICLWLKFANTQAFLVPNNFEIFALAVPGSAVVGIDHGLAPGAMVRHATTHEWGHMPTTTPATKLWLISLLPQCFSLQQVKHAMYTIFEAELSCFLREYKAMHTWWCHSTVKPVYNDHLVGYFSAFWGSSRWPGAT